MWKLIIFSKRVFICRSSFLEKFDQLNTMLFYKSWKFGKTLIFSLLLSIFGHLLCISRSKITENNFKNKGFFKILREFDNAVILSDQIGSNNVFWAFCPISHNRPSFNVVLSWLKSASHLCARKIFFFFNAATRFVEFNYYTSSYLLLTT